MTVIQMEREQRTRAVQAAQLAPPSGAAGARSAEAEALPRNCDVSFRWKNAWQEVSRSWMFHSLSLKSCCY